MDLKDFGLKLKRDGWKKIGKGFYPRPWIWDYLEITHPEIINEYKKWFDKVVRK